MSTCTDYYVANQLHKQLLNVSDLTPSDLDAIINKTKDSVDVNYTNYIKFQMKYEKMPRSFWVDDVPVRSDIKECKDIINILKQCKNILITAGAGFSVDSGVKTYEDDNVVLDHKTLCNLQPHKGYMNLLSYVSDKNYFVMTTNIDSLFRKAGFKNIYECHGNGTILESSGRMNICERNNCKWESEKYKKQEIEFDKWISETKDITVIELGCGIMVPTIKEHNSLLVNRKDVKLIIVNPKHYNKYNDSTFVYSGSCSEFMNECISLTLK